MECEKHNKLVNSTNKRLTLKYRKQTTDEQNGEGATRGGGVKGTNYWVLRETHEYVVQQEEHSQYFINVL